MAALPRARVVFIGASNMSRGLAILCHVATHAWGAPLELLAALGFGRSYGLTSCVLGRTLPSVLDCGLWRRIEEPFQGTMVAFVGDVGNDLLYGQDVDTILRWVRECVHRLRAAGARVVLTSLPPTIESLTRRRFLLFRSLLFRRSPLQFDVLQSAGPALDAGLRAIARDEDAQLVSLRREWYGLDPIHIRRRQCGDAWREIVSAAAAAPVPGCAPLGRLRSLSGYLLFPERQAVFGVSMRRPQPYRLEGGTTIALY